MISAKDRVPLYPGRTKMMPVSGQPNVYDLTRADQPQREGTPLNRRTMQLLQADIRTYPVKAGETVVAGDVVDVVGGKVTSGRTPIGSLAVGSIIELNVGGVPTEFIVVHHGKPSSIYSSTFTGGTILMMKDIYENRQWHSAKVNDYANSTIHSYLNNTFLVKLDAEVRAAVKQVKIPYRAGSGVSTAVSSGESGLAAKVWLASGYELGWTASNHNGFPADGAKFSYFLSGDTADARVKRVGCLNAAPAAWWTRSPDCSSNGTTAWRVVDNGNYYITSCSESLGIRPCLVLPDTFMARIATEYSQAIALASGAGGQNIDVIFDGTAELPGITAGTSITSPGVQGYSPQAGWLWVKPEWDAKPFVVGSYTGDGTNSLFVELGFRPAAVFITGEISNAGTILSVGSSGIEISTISAGKNAADIYKNVIDLTSTGFTVKNYNAATSGKVYSYIAFRG